MIAHKTKAALHGRQSSHIKSKQSQLTRLTAGGQTLSRRNSHAQMDFAQLFESCTCGLEVPAKVVDSCGDRAVLRHEENQQHPALGRNPDLAYERVVPQSHEVNRVVTHGYEVNQLSLSEPVNQPSLRGSVNGITGSNPVQLSGSDLAFLRCRRLISPTAAAIRKPAVLSPLSFTDSISSNTSCGTRTFTCFDLLFIEPVAITGSPCVRCYSLYAKKNHIQCLTCYSPSNMVNSTLIEARCRNGNASDCGSSTEASNHKPLSEVTVMADQQHTQTRPKYQYRFLALSAIGHNILHITATTEREAREQSPAGCVMVFAGRLPVREVRHA